ncbi:MAG: acyl-CoA synthetase [Cellvibrionaceae bacterium]|nr:acyl-CoA synthetase [Cellvibrionaceae bacterium]
MAKLRIKNIQDIREIEATALSQRNLPSSSYEVFCRSAQSYGERIALRYIEQLNPEIKDQSFTYSELLSMIHRCANAFSQLGASVEKPVAMLLNNIPQAHFTIWGAEASACVCPINPMLELEHICAVLNEARAHILVIAEQHLEALKSIVEQVESLQAVFFVGDEKQLNTLGELDVIVHGFDAYIARCQEDTLLVQAPVAQQRASLFHTGGTTGVPKLAPHSHFNEVVNAWQFSSCVDMDEQDIGLCVLPMFHVNGVFVTGLAPFMAGAQVVLATPEGYRNPEVQKQFWKIIEHYAVSYFSTVPTIIHDLLQLPSKSYDLSSLRFAGCGAAPLSREVMRRFEEKTGLRLLEGYGLTESTAVSSIHAPGIEQRPGSVGLRVPYLQIKIAAKQTDGTFVDCQNKELGSVLIKGPNVFSGYTDQQKNKDIWAGHDWLDTGDLGYLDEQEYLWLAGRSKDLIIRGGHNIDPLMIEEAFYKHEAVAVAAAIGKPDPRVGELPVIYIQLKSAGSISANELLEYCRGYIPEKAAVPKEVHFIEEIPTTAVGKVFKPGLLRDIACKVVVEQLETLDIQAQVNVIDDSSCGFRIEIVISGSGIRRAELDHLLGQYSFAYTIIAN